MADEPEPIERISVRIAWVGLEDERIAFVNQIIGQVDDKGEAILTFGQATPPVLLGSPDEQRAQAAAVSFVQVRPVARLALSRTRLKELREIVDQTLKNQAPYLERASEEPE